MFATETVVLLGGSRVPARSLNAGTRQFLGFPPSEERSLTPGVPLPAQWPHLEVGPCGLWSHLGGGRGPEQTPLRSKGPPGAHGLFLYVYSLGPSGLILPLGPRAGWELVWKCDPGRAQQGLGRRRVCWALIVPPHPNGSLVDLLVDTVAFLSSPG